MKICFAASSGGHLEELMMLYPMMKETESFIFTEKTRYNYNSKGMKSYKVSQINRREILFPVKFMYLILSTLFILVKERPTTIISTGALATVPICILGKLFGKKIIFIESFSRITSPTLTGKIVYRFADLFIVQWEEMKQFYPKAIYGGGIF